MARPMVRRAIIIASAAVSALLVGAGILLPADRYNSLTAGTQAVAVLVALAIAVATLQADSRGRRIDRTLSFHEQFSTGEMQAIGGRIVDLIKQYGEEGRLRQLLMSDLREDNSPLRCYSKDMNEKPSRDGARILGFWERFNAARKAGAVNDTLLFDLLGGPAMWWDLALQMTDEERKQGLSEMACWAHEFARLHPAHPRTQGWAETRHQDFGCNGPAPAPRPANIPPDDSAA